eukprot:9362129-Karenia_brevis.AAC.1
MRQQRKRKKTRRRKSKALGASRAEEKLRKNKWQWRRAGAVRLWRNAKRLVEQMMVKRVKGRRWSKKEKL